MVVIKVTNCNYNNRPNQNTTFWFDKTKRGYSKEFVFEELDVLNNLTKLTKGNVIKQKNTKIEIIRQ